MSKMGGSNVRKTKPILRPRTRRDRVAPCSYLGRIGPFAALASLRESIRLLRVSGRSAFFVGSGGDDTGEAGSDVRAIVVYWPAVVAGDGCSAGGRVVLDGVQGR